MPENDARIPIVVGVTGHRDIPVACHADLERRVIGALEQVQALYPSSPIELMSPLADGGDRICARAALALGIRLVAPLPMAAEAYRQDFDAASQAEFDALAAKADEVFPVDRTPGTIASGDRGPYYRRAGQFMADHAHLLIALWDGRETLFPAGGGTYETVLFARRSGIPVLIIPAPREGGAPVEDGAPAAPSPDDRLLMIDRFNRDALAHAAYRSNAARAAAPYLMGELPFDALCASAQRLARVGLCADALSIRWRNEKLRVLRVLSVLGLAMVLCFLLYDEMESNLMLLGYAGVLVAAFLVWRRSCRDQPHEKYVCHRVIAELMRVQFYWQILGVGQGAFSGLHFTQKVELPFLEFMMRPMRASVASAPTQGARTCVEACFIAGQLGYHRNAERAKQRKERTNATALAWMTALSVILLVLIGGLELLGGALLERALPLEAVERLLILHDAQAVTLRSVLKILLGAVTAGTAFLANYYGDLALPQQIGDNQRMQSLFDRASGQLQDDPDALCEVARTLGSEAANECANWYISQKDRAPKLFM